MGNPINTGPGNNINGGVLFNPSFYNPPCPPGVFVVNSSSIGFSGSGSTCDPISAFVLISQVAGNSLKIFADGLYASGGTGGGTPGGLNTQIQFNNSGIFAGSSNLIWNGSSVIVTTPSVVQTVYPAFVAQNNGAATSGRPQYGGFYYSNGSSFLGSSLPSSIRWGNEPTINQSTQANVYVIQGSTNGGPYTTFVSISDFNGGTWAMGNIALVAAGGGGQGSIASGLGLFNNILVQNNITFGVGGTSAVPSLQFAAGVLLTSIANQAIEVTSNHIYYSANGVRYQLDQQTGLFLSGVTNPISDIAGVIGLILSPTAGNSLQILANGLYASGGTLSVALNGDVSGTTLASEVIGILGFALPVISNGFLKVINTIMIPVTNITSFGDSITVGMNATANQGYAQLFAANYGKSLINLALSGSGVWNMAKAAFASLTPNSTYVTAMAGFNDYRRSGTNAETDQKLIGCFSSLLAQQWKNAFIDGSDVSTITWSTPPSTFAASSVGGIGNGGYQSPGSGIQSGTWTFTGNNVVVGLIGNSGAVETYGTVKIYIDGVLKDTINTNALYDDISDGVYDNRRGPYAKIYLGLSNGTHTVKFESQGDGYCVLNYFSTLLAPASCKPVLFYEIPYMNPTGYAISPNLGSTPIFAAASLLIKNIVTAFQAQLYPIDYIPTNNFYNLGTGVSSDNIHPNDTGHAQIETGAISIVSPGLFQRWSFDSSVYVSSASNPLLITGNNISLTLSPTSGNTLAILGNGLYASGGTSGSAWPTQQTLIANPNISFDYSKGTFGIVNISGTTGISFSNLTIPSFVVIKATNVISGSTISLPGRLNTTFTWAIPSGGTTLMDGYWDGNEWLWVGDCFIASSGTTSGDTDANNWIAAVTANGFTPSANQQTYMTSLVTSLKSAGLWSRASAIYVPIFGSANTNKWNIKNSVDSDGAFRLTFSGGWTYLTTGAQGDGSTGIANTHYNGSVSGLLNSYGLGMYFQGAGGTQSLPMGTYDGSNGAHIVRGPTTVAARINSVNAYGPISATNTRLVYASRVDASNIIMYRDGSSLGSQAVASTSEPNLATYLGAVDSGFFGDSLFSFAIITDGFSAVDVTALNNAVNSFMTSWGINV